MSDKLLTDLRNGKIGETLAANVQLYLASATKSKASQKLDKYGSLSMKLLRGCIQILSDSAIDHSNIGHLVQIATDAYRCVQKTKSQLLPPPLALEKLICHIACQLLKAQFFADALAFVGYLKQELQSVEPDARDNEYETICKHVHNQLWSAGLSLQEASKQSKAKHGLILNTRRLALSTLLLTGPDRKWIIDRFLRVGGEFEQKAKNDPKRYGSLCSYFATVVEDLLNCSDFKSRLKESFGSEEDLDSLFCPVVELTVQYTKCSVLGKGHGGATSTCEVLLDLLQGVKTNCGTGISLIYLRATLSLMRVILYHSQPDGKQQISNARLKKNRKVIATSKCELINIFERDLQGVRKEMEKEEHRILPITTLAEGLDLFRKTQEKCSGQQEPADPTRQTMPQVLSTLRVSVDLLTFMKRYYTGCEEGDEALGGKPPGQLYQKCIGRLLSTLDLMSSIHLQALREVTNEVDTDLVSECLWAVQTREQVIGSVSQGGGGSLSMDEHRWLGNVSYNLGLILYQKQAYETAEELILLSNRHLILWCTLGEQLQLDRVQKVNLWNKMELQLDCQRRLNNPDSALNTVATVLSYDLKEPRAGVQRSKWLELWWKVKRDLAKKEEYEELRSSTILDIVKNIEPSLTDEFLSPLADLLEDELKIYEQQKHDTLHEEYAVVCDLLDLYQCDELLAERALVLIKLSHLLRTGRLESNDTPAECVETAISLIQDHFEEAPSQEHKLQDILAQAYFWSYICSSEKLTSTQGVDDEGTSPVLSPQIGTSWDNLSPLLSALDIWESMPTDLRFSAGVLKHPRGTIFCLRRMAEIHGLQQLPLLQLRALSTAVLIAQAVEGVEVQVSLTFDLCSLSRVMCTLGMLDEACIILRKAKEALAALSSQDKEPLVQCTLNITDFWVSMYKKETENLNKILLDLIKFTNQMSHNYDRYCVEAETKLMLATYTAVTTGSIVTSAIGWEIDLELAPMQPAQEAMRLFTGVSKGLMGREFDGNVEQQTVISPWSVLQRVLESFHLVGELYTLQGCVREAKYYLQEGLSVCQLYGLPRWIATFNLSLCESHILQGAEESSMATLKAAESVMQEALPSEQSSKPKGNPKSCSSSKRLSSADDSLDDSFVLHTRKMSLSDLCDDPQGPLADLSLPSPSFLSHKAGCDCHPCSDLELHRCWLHLFAFFARVAGVSHKHFDCLVSQGEALWNWSKQRWQSSAPSDLENVSVLTENLTKGSPLTDGCLSRLSLDHSKIVNSRVISRLAAAEYSAASETISEGIITLELSQIQVGRASMEAEFLYMRALLHIYRLDGSDVKASIRELVTTSWSVLRSPDFTIAEEVSEQMGQLSLEDAIGQADLKGAENPSTPARWVDSTARAFSRPELARKQTGRRGTKAKRDKSDSIGLFSDIVDEAGEDQRLLPKPKQETTTAKKKKAVQLRVKKGSLFVESNDMRPSSAVFVEELPSSDVFAFDEDSMEKKPKRGRDRRKKETDTASVLPQNMQRARPRRGKAGAKKQDLTEAEDSMAAEGNKNANESVRTVRGKPSGAKISKSSKAKDSKLPIDEEPKLKKPTRRRGRPAATEKVRRNFSEELDGSFHISDESFCGFADDESLGLNDMLSPKGNASLYLEEAVVAVGRVEEMDECLWSNSSQLLACEEVEIPRAFSEEEEVSAPKRRGRRGTVKDGAAANKKQAPRQNHEPMPDDDIGGIDAAIKSLEEALLLIRTTAPCPSYRKICQLLALCLGEKQPQRAANILSEASSVTLRHQKLTSLVKKLRKQKHSEESKTSEDDDKTPSKKTKNTTTSSRENQRLLSSSRLFSFRLESNTVQEVLELLPSGWAVCQLSVVDVGPSSPGYLTDTSVVIMTRLGHGADPRVVHLPLMESGLPGKSAEDLMSEFDEIFRESKETVKNKDKLVWWASRQSLNDQLKDLMESMEQVFFGCWKGLVLGQVKCQSLQDEISEAAKVFTKLSASLSEREVCPIMCQSLINACLQLGRQDLVQALASTMGLPVGSDDLSQAVLAFQDLTRDIGPKLKAASRCPTVLILDKQLQHIPWESTPILRDTPVFRMPSLHFLRSSLLARSDPEAILGRGVNTEATSFVLNPSKDLTNTQKIFQDWFEKEKKWQGVTGRIPSKDEYTTALTNQDLFIYCGHGNGREYFSGDEIERLTCRAATLLIGCSSGKLTVNGSLDAKGMALSYIVAECPCIVANLWDVTDRDIDRFLENLLKAWMKGRDQDHSLLDFIAEARNSCRLPYLIGSAPVMYGLPVHLKN